MRLHKTFVQERSVNERGITAWTCRRACSSGAGRRSRDLRALADFIDEQAAFVAQKGIYEYSRARAGHYAKVLFAEKEFHDAVERSRWRAFPLGLAMVAELVEGVLRPHAGADGATGSSKPCALVLSVFDRYPIPDALGAAGWSERAPNWRAGCS